MMYVENFNPIDGWLTRWKERNNIVYRKLHGEKQDTDFDAAVNWMTTILPQLLKDYDPLRSSTQMKRDCSIRLYQSTLICLKPSPVKDTKKLNNN